MSSTLIQVIGFVGLVSIVLSFQLKSRSNILIFMALGQLIFLVHFVLLGAWTAVGMNVVGTTRTLVFRFGEGKKWGSRKFWPFLFIILFIAAGLSARESWLGVLPVIAMVTETSGLWLKDLRKLRIVNLFPHPFWFTYNLIKGSWAGVVCEIFVFTSIIVAIVRYDIIGHKQPKKGK